MEEIKNINISCVSLNTTPLDFVGNLDLHKQALESNETKNSKIILFPELSLTGYGCEDSFYFPWVWEKSIESIGKLLPYSKDRLIVVGCPIFVNPYLYNTSVVISHGKIRGVVAKRNLANTGIHYEKRWFTEWRGESQSIQNLFPAHYTDGEIFIGDLIFHWQDTKIGIEICEDSWVVHRPSHSYSELGADIILCPGASHFAFGKYETRSRIFQESSRAQGNVFAFANLIGNESGRSIFDGGNLILESGNILSIGKILPLTNISICNAVINTSTLHSNRAKNFRRSTLENFIKKIASIPETPYLNSAQSEPIDDLPKENIYLAFTSALILGLFDYLRKSGMKGYTLSLSGGADSSVLAILVASMKSAVTKERGDGFLESIGINQNILTTIYQKTKNNSPLTQEIAENLAKELLADHHNIEIDHEVDSMVDLISKALNKSLNWKEDGIALQNIQARVRSPLVWLLANVKNQLLLSTGNRSESSVGYTTMDGDSSGSICPIAGVSKKFLLEWLHFIHKKGDPRIPELASLDMLLNTRPSAELKPLEENQEDEKDLMPYPILQDIEEAFVLKGMNPTEILNLLSRKWDSYSEHELKQMLNRYLSLFRISQWKRERMAVSFHLDEYGLDPKTSFRFPVLSGKWNLPT